MMKSIFDGNTIIESTTYKQQAYTLIRNAIINRQLKEGQLYSQDQLSSEFNISRTPVREALMELQKEGYIYFMRGRGFGIVTISEKDRDEIYVFRKIVETAACSIAVKNLTQEGLNKLKINLAQQENELNNNEERAFLELDERFHYIIWEATDNSRIINATNELRNQLIRSGYDVLYNNRKNKQIVIEEHKAIYKGLCGRDAKASKDAMEKHIENTYERVLSKGVKKG